MEIPIPYTDMNRSLPTVAATAAAFVLTACADIPAANRNAWHAVVDTLGDTITVRTLAGSVWGDTVTLEPEVLIGLLEGEDAYLIGEPQSLAVGPTGIIYVLDTQVPVVRAYAPNGTHLRDIGRKGGGPGEYQAPDGMTAARDGRVLVRDPGGARIVVYDSAGAFLEQWPLSGGFNTSRPLAFDTSGRVYTTVLLNRGTPPWEWIMGMLRYSAEGQPLDTVQAPTWDFEPARITASRERSSSSSSVPFTPQRSWAFSPLGYMVGGVSTDYRIDLYRTGGPVLRLERAWTPVPVHAEEAEERRQAQIERFKRQYGSWRWNGPPIPDAKPPFRELFVSQEGNVWVLLSQTGRAVLSEDEAREEERRSGRRPYRYREHPAFDVFAPDGRYFGHVRVPEAFEVEPQPWVQGNRVWAVTRDDLDVARVVRFRMVPSSN
jgi:hypothetical protein